METELGGYDMEGFMLYLGSDMNLLPNTYWEVMGKPNLVWSPIQLWSGQSVQNLTNRLTRASGGEYRKSKKKG